MAPPTEYKAFRRTTGDLPHTIEKSIEYLPSQLQPTEVLIKIHAVSLNYRDVAMLNGTYPVPVEERGISASDCAAEVVEVGSEVKSFKAGERVAPIFDTKNFTGLEDERSTALGGDEAGVLREFAVFDERVLVKLPEHLSWDEVSHDCAMVRYLTYETDQILQASTLACAGVTAWNALNFPDLLKTARYALLQGKCTTSPSSDRCNSSHASGTGGVSMFALIICHAAGITPIITSSSDAKLASIQKQYPGTLGINYKTQPDQLAEIQRLTNGNGVDIVVNNTGVASLITDVQSLRSRGGVVSLVGFLAQDQAAWDPSALMALMGKQAKLKGIGVGSKVDFENLNEFLTEHKVQLQPLIDRVFEFEKSPEAFDYLYSGKHVGKVVIKV